ncbi:MAG: ribonuclease Z [Bacteroidaceae bacterium]|nr:ribonuclease Z [Bacteroidaceae bacterium]
MEKFEINILGCGAALPTPRRLGSSQVVNIREKLFMLDCAEGTQMAFRKSRLSFSHLQAIFLTHLHGDHVFGLLGLLSTFGLLGRIQELHIYGPKDLQRVFQPQIDYFCTDAPYRIILHEIDTQTPHTIYEDRSVIVTTLPLTHRVPCCGYLFQEKPTPRHIRRDMIDYYHIPIAHINNIKAGMDWTQADGTIIPNDRLTTPPDPVRSYAYCTDTAYRPPLADLLQDVTCLYHEATFTHEHALLAKKTHHSTATQTAEIAKAAHAHQLILGHFSSRYKTEVPLLQEAQQVFPNTILAEDGMKIVL